MHRGKDSDELVIYAIRGLESNLPKDSVHQSINYVATQDMIRDVNMSNIIKINKLTKNEICEQCG